ncbi:hypothetical protein IW140_002971 [Coemansia sp. RSA 1813]|nr:hypothetical protein EV178_003825 [Coemansia sp. RSA 1646]KAJ1770601.1 hypothetical protein LPJ74_003050 [Coemansia sp. RSA 1843]KAJ2091401.1 hypothetical protein IW138_001860 [Coemansia sp. RSA 986]KAJ2212842.1 hypothetical protein EV179_004329 [Coemansia sp. RSA 487]KAJ2569563.1 hypothetical protein IW140_002971 [Coemansia sp. RSA 1813]
MNRAHKRWTASGLLQQTISATYRHGHKPPHACSHVRAAHNWTEAHQMFAKLGDNAYRILGLEPTCTGDEIKKQYYKLCRELHPDTYMNSKAKPSVLGEKEWRQMKPDERRRAMHERFVMVTSAYEVLSDPGLRQKYNIHVRSGGKHHTNDPWASERPYGYYEEYWRRQRSQERAINDWRLTWGVFGFVGVLALVSVFQKLLQYDDMQWMHEVEHFRSVDALENARERARERMREVPPGQMKEYEARRLRRAAEMDGGATTRAAGPEFGRLWPHGSGLGLVALLSDRQLCGVDARRQVAADPDVAKSRDTVRRALASDRVISKYLLDQPSSSPSDGDSKAL